jgi:hypothetical protein
MSGVNVTPNVDFMGAFGEAIKKLTVASRACKLNAFKTTIF